MRNDVMWATDGGPIIGQIKHGKRYDSGSVSEDKYEVGKAEIDEKLIGLQQAVIEMNGTVGQITNSLVTLEAQYRTTVPGLAAEIAELKLDVNNIKNTAASTVEAITRLENKEAGDIQAVTEIISTINTGLDALSDLVHEHSTAISLNETEIQHLKSLISEIRAGVNSNTSGLAALSGTVSELTRTHQVDKATLDERINAVNTVLSNLTATVNSNAAQTETKISEIRSTLLTATQNIAALQNSFSTIETNVSALQTASSAASQDIATLKSNVSNISEEIESEKADIQRVESRMTSYEVSQSTLRNQILNVGQHADDRIDAVEADKDAVKQNVTNISNNLNEFTQETGIAMAELNRRVTILEGSEPLDILSFKATPAICEIGGSENVVLSWTISGGYETIRINDEVVTGDTSSKSVPNVRTDTEFTIAVTNIKGQTVTAKANVTFVNHVYIGTDATGAYTEGVIKAFDDDELTDSRARSIRYTANDEYLYYAYPKRLGASEFESNVGSGGFMDPRVVSVNNHSGYTEDYYIYRSANKLSGTFKINVV